MELATLYSIYFANGITNAFFKRGKSWILWKDFPHSIKQNIMRNQNSSQLSSY